MRRFQLLPLLLVFPAGLSAQIFSIQRSLYGSPLIDAVLRNQFPRGGSYTATIQGTGLSHVTGFASSDPRVTGTVTSAADAVVTVQISSSPVSCNESGCDKAHAPIPGVSFSLQTPSGPISSGLVTFDIILNPPPLISVFKITDSTKWIPGGVKTTVKFTFSIVTYGNIQFSYIGCGNCFIHDWTGTGDQFISTQYFSADVTVPADFSLTTFGIGTGEVDGAGQSSVLQADPTKPAGVIIPVVQMQLVDPVPALLDGPAVTSDPSLLGNQGLGTIVKGAAADGVTTLVIRIAGAPPSENLSLNVAQDGELSNITSQNFSSSIPVQTDSSGNAFVLYRAPVDFVRASVIDDTVEASRTVDLNFQSSDNPGVIGDTKITIVRPPVLLIHGLWASPADWFPFILTLNPGLFKVSVLSYNYPLPPTTSTTPSYSASTLSKATTASLGYRFNAATVFQQALDAIDGFKNANSVAAVQADVVAHSMGGLVTRTLPSFGSTYYSGNTFGAGFVHKLITIDSPHLGSPLANNLLLSSNSCVRSLFALKGMLSVQSLTIGTVPISGAVGDLSVGSSALIGLQHPPSSGATIPTAFIAGLMSPTQLGGAGQTLLGKVVHDTCGLIARNPLALELTPTGWLSVFGGENGDGIVSLSSQLAGNPFSIFGPWPTVTVVHSRGVEDLGFKAPDALDSSDVVAAVIKFLNTSKTDPAFVPLY